MEAALRDTEKNFTEQLAAFGISLSPEQLMQFRQFYENLIKWNEVMNLTAITEEADVYTKHFLDSLSIVGLVGPGSFEKLSVIDIGTGAGFPGLPIAIAFPGAQVTLVDSLQKRVKFLEETVKLLGLRNVQIFHSRAEDFGRIEAKREHYDIACSRAVARLNVLAEYCLPLVKKAAISLPTRRTALRKKWKTARRPQPFSEGKWIR